MSMMKRYNEVFNEITISNEKMYDIKEMMVGTSIAKRKIGFKKYVVITVSLILVLSMGIIVNAATNGELFGKIVNIIGLNIDGNEIDKNDYNQYLDKDGNIETDKLPEAAGEGGLIYIQKDKDGNIISYTVITADDPRNASGWQWDINGENRYLRIPEKAQLLCDLELVDINGEKYANMSGVVDSLPRVIPFSYDEKEYTMVLNGEYNPMPSGAIYEGIVEYDPTELYEDYEMINLKKEVDKE